METFVSQIGRPQQGVHDRVHQHIAVAMAGESSVMGNIHSAEDKPAAFGQGMGIETDPRAEF